MRSIARLALWPQVAARNIYNKETFVQHKVKVQPNYKSRLRVHKGQVAYSSMYFSFLPISKCCKIGNLTRFLYFNLSNNFTICVYIFKEYNKIISVHLTFFLNFVFNLQRIENFLHSFQTLDQLTKQSVNASDISLKIRHLLIDQIFNTTDFSKYACLITTKENSLWRTWELENRHEVKIGNDPKYRQKRQHHCFLTISFTSVYSSGTSVLMYLKIKYTKLI